jgi:hypothetical protein
MPEIITFYDKSVIFLTIFLPFVRHICHPSSTKNARFATDMAQMTDLSAIFDFFTKKAAYPCPALFHPIFSRFYPHFDPQNPYRNILHPIWQ